MHMKSLKIHILHLNISVFKYHLVFVFGVVFFFISLKNKLKLSKTSLELKNKSLLFCNYIIIIFHFK